MKKRQQVRIFICFALSWLALSVCGFLAAQHASSHAELAKADQAETFGTITEVGSSEDIISYSYQVSGKTYVQREFVGQKGAVKGQEIEVFYNPDKPAMSYTSLGSPSSIVGHLRRTTLLLAVMTVLMSFAWLYSVMSAPARKRAPGYRLSF